MPEDFLKVTVRGDREVMRALRQLPDDAEQELTQGMTLVSQQLADRIRAAGSADTRQSAAAARTVRAVAGTRPQVEAGPEKRLFGSEFGIVRRTGWYRLARYEDSVARQYRAHRGSASYWFFRTQDANRAWIAEQWAQVADTVVRQWSA